MAEPEPAPRPHAIPPARIASGSLATQIAIVVAIVALTVGAIVAIHLLEPELELEHWLVLTAQLGAGAIGLVALLLRPYVRRWLAAISIDQWRAIDAETERDPRRNPHVTTMIVLLTCAISLTIQEYVGGADKYERWFPYDGGEYWELSGFIWWTVWRVIGYVVIPVIVILCMPGERLRSYHVSVRGFFRHLWIYGVMFVAFSPIVIIASLSDSFRTTYPFYRLANRSHFDLWSWEALYIVQFVALEFFFRGFLLQALRRALGANAIFVMMVPYCMIHYGKPMAETIGAIGAGLVLGTLAMRTRSIWGGVMIHVGVATSMDVLALQGCPPIGSNEYCHT
jgi:membrane protease YdiL (CAAX protease family)